LRMIFPISFGKRLVGEVSFFWMVIVTIEFNYLP
jgi:hypothetical protein